MVHNRYKTMKDIDVRPYKKDDRIQCAELAVQAWPIVDTLVEKAHEVTLMTAKMELVEIFSTYSEVMHNHGSIIGFLFGFIKKDYHFIRIIKAIMSVIVVCAKVLFNTCGRIKNPLKVFSLMMSADTTTQKIRDKFDGEVVFIVVAQAYRGKGLGRQLIGRFHNNAVSKASPKIMVTTDETSNWKFYEIIGYRRIGVYEEKLSSYIMNKRINGFVYGIELRR
jgi:ribosomal protein S18 acetylase RimI-like enzyme